MGFWDDLIASQQQQQDPQPAQQQQPDNLYVPDGGGFWDQLIQSQQDYQQQQQQPPPPNLDTSNIWGTLNSFTNNAYQQASDSDWFTRTWDAVADPWQAPDKQGMAPWEWLGDNANRVAESALGGLGQAITPAGDWTNELANSEVPGISQAAQAAQFGWKNVVEPVGNFPTSVYGALSNGGNPLDMLHGAGPAGYVVGGAWDLLTGKDPTQYYRDVADKLPQTQLGKMAFEPGYYEGLTSEQSTQNPLTLAEAPGLSDFAKLPAPVQLGIQFSSTLNPGNHVYNAAINPVLRGAGKLAGGAADITGLSDVGRGIATRLESPQMKNAKVGNENYFAAQVLKDAEAALPETTDPALRSYTARTEVFENPDSQFYWERQGISPQVAGEARFMLEAERQQTAATTPDNTQTPYQGQVGQAASDFGRQVQDTSPGAANTLFDEAVPKPPNRYTPAEPTAPVPATGGGLDEFFPERKTDAAPSGPINIPDYVKAIGIPEKVASHEDFLGAVQKSLGVKSKAYKLETEGTPKPYVRDTKPLEQFGAAGRALNAFGNLTMPFMSRAYLNNSGRAFRDTASNLVKYTMEGFGRSGDTVPRFERVTGESGTAPMGRASITADVGSGTGGGKSSVAANAFFHVINPFGEIGSDILRKVTKGKFNDFNDFVEKNESSLKAYAYKREFLKRFDQAVDRQVQSGQLAPELGYHIKQGTLTPAMLNDWIKGRMPQGSSLADAVAKRYNPLNMSDEARAQLSQVLSGHAGPIGDIVVNSLGSLQKRVDAYNAQNKARYDAALAKIGNKKTSNPKVSEERRKTVQALYQQTRPLKLEDITPDHPIWKAMEKDVYDNLTAAQKSAEVVEQTDPKIKLAVRNQIYQTLQWAAKDGSLKNLKRSLDRDIAQRDRAGDFKQYEQVRQQPQEQAATQLPTRPEPPMNPDAALKNELLQYAKIPNRSFPANKAIATIEGRGNPGDVVVRYQKEGATHFRATAPDKVREGETVAWQPKAATNPTTTRLATPAEREAVVSKPVPKPVEEAAPAKKATPDTFAYGADPNTVYKFTHKVVSLDDLIPSNTDTGAVNPNYTAELQPRDRTRIASTRQIDTLAKSLVPEHLLTDFKQLEKGAPIVGSDRMVESGNGRTLALRKARGENPEKWNEYQTKLKEVLPDYGIDPSSIKGIKDPVLIRERTSDVPDRAEFAREANNPPVLGMSPLETAAQDARLLNQDKLLSFKIGEDQNIDEALTAAANRDFVSSFIGELPSTEQARLITKYGTLNQDGLRRIKAAMFTRLFPGEAGKRLAETFMEALDSRTRNFETAVSATMPKLTRMQGLIEAGQRVGELDITADIAAAIDAQARLRAQGIKVADYLGQSSMFEKELTPFQEYLLQYFDEIGNKPAQIKKFLNEYAEAVENAPDPHQMGLFGAVEQPTKEAILEQLTGRKAPSPEIGKTRQAATLPAAATEAEIAASTKAREELARRPSPSPDQLKGGVADLPKPVAVADTAAAAKRSRVIIDAFPKKPQAREVSGKYEHYYPITSKGKDTGYELVSSTHTVSDDAPVNDRVWQIKNTATGEVINGKFRPDSNAVTAIKDAIRGPGEPPTPKPAPKPKPKPAPSVVAPVARSVAELPKPVTQATKPVATPKPVEPVVEKAQPVASPKTVLASAPTPVQPGDFDLQTFSDKVNRPLSLKLPVEDGAGNVLTPSTMRKMLAGWNRTDTLKTSGDVYTPRLSLGQKAQYRRDFMATDEYYRRESGNTFKLDLDTFSPVRIADGVSLDELTGRSRPGTIGEPRPQWPTDFPTDMDGVIKAVEGYMGEDAYKLFALMKQEGDTAGIDMAYSDIARAMGFPDPTNIKTGTERVGMETDQARQYLKVIADDAFKRKQEAGKAQTKADTDQAKDQGKVESLAQYILGERTKAVTEAGRGASDKVEQVYFDYRNKNVLDQALGSLLPFGYWGRRNFAYTARYFSNHPAQFAAVLNFYKNIEQQNTQDGTIPDYYKGNLLLWVNPDGSRVMWNFSSTLPFNPLGNSDSLMQVVGSDDQDTRTVNQTPLAMLFGSDRVNAAGKVTGRNKGIASTFLQPNPVVDILTKTGQVSNLMKAFGMTSDGFGSPDPSENRGITQTVGLIPGRFAIRDMAARTGLTQLLRDNLAKVGIKMSDLDLEAPVNNIIFGANSGKPQTKLINELTEMAQGDPKNKEKYLLALAEYKKGNWTPEALRALDVVDAQGAWQRAASLAGFVSVVANTPREQLVGQLFNAYNQVKGDKGHYDITSVDPKTGYETRKYVEGASSKFQNDNAGLGIQFGKNKTADQVVEGIGNDRTAAEVTKLNKSYYDDKTMDLRTYNKLMDDLKRGNPTYFKVSKDKDYQQAKGELPYLPGEKHSTVGEVDTKYFKQENPAERKYQEFTNTLANIGGKRYDDLSAQVSALYDQKRNKEAYALQQTPEYKAAKKERDAYLAANPAEAARYKAETEAKYGPSKTTSSTATTSNGSSNYSSGGGSSGYKSTGGSSYSYTPKKSTAASSTKAKSTGGTSSSGGSSSTAPFTNAQKAAYAYARNTLGYNATQAAGYARKVPATQKSYYAPGSSGSTTTKSVAALPKPTSSGKTSVDSAKSGTYNQGKGSSVPGTLRNVASLPPPVRSSGGGGGGSKKAPKAPIHNFLPGPNTSLIKFSKRRRYK